MNPTPLYTSICATSAVITNSVLTVATYNPPVVTLTPDGGIYWHGVPMHWLLLATFALNLMQLFVAMWEKRR